jgi:hypothetical protein
MEAAEPNIMRRKPRPRSEGVFADGFGVQILWQGAMFAALTLTGFVVGWRATGDLTAGRTMAFLILSLTQVFHRVQHALAALAVENRPVQKPRAHGRGRGLHPADRTGNVFAAGGGGVWPDKPCARAVRAGARAGLRPGCRHGSGEVLHEAARALKELWPKLVFRKKIRKGIFAACSLPDTVSVVVFDNGQAASICSLRPFPAVSIMKVRIQNGIRASRRIGKRAYLWFIV